ncbi:MAG: SMC-Scp complex subunit ScpB [Candidatus Berkiellales bacterium]
MTKTKIDLVKLIEGFLFASSEPLSAEAIARMFSEEPKKPSLGEIRKALNQLKTEYENRGIELVEVASGFRFQVTPMVAPYVAKSLEDKPSRYSRALLETLALIAYRQPITRSEIEDIRGVVVSTYIVKTLEEHEWIRVVGHKDVPGKPALYATTKYFLDHFGLKSLEDLPPLAELKNLEGFATHEPVAAEASIESRSLELPDNEAEEEQPLPRREVEVEEVIEEECVL